MRVSTKANCTGLTGDARSWRIAQVLVPVILTISCAMLAGCNVVGALNYKLRGPPAVDAQYVPAQEPMLVLVENYHASGENADAEMLARCLMTELEEHKVAPLIPLDTLYALRTNKGNEYRRMSMATIGRETGAKQVLYVDVQESEIGRATGSELMKGRIAVQVRVVDVETGATRWPPQASEGVPLAYQTPLPRADVTTTEAMVRQHTQQEMAIRVARLFYKWKPDESTDELDTVESR